MEEVWWRPAREGKGQYTKGVRDGRREKGGGSVAHPTLGFTTEKEDFYYLYSSVVTCNRLLECPTRCNKGAETETKTIFEVLNLSLSL
jgi:hypothetical protein